MATRQYIGARYIPVFADPVEWSDDRAYEYLTMVQHVGETYMSKQEVPIGAELPDTEQGEESNEYWVHMSNWNAQVESYRQEVLQYNDRISTVENDLPISGFSSTNTVKKAIDDTNDLLPASSFDSTNTVKKAIDDTNDLLPATSFSSVNTVKKAIDDVSDLLPATAFDTVNTVDARFDAIEADGWVTTNRVNDGAITKAKLASGILDKFDYIYFPENYGAIGDGVTDDTQAFEDMLDDVSPKSVIVLRENAVYLISNTLNVDTSGLSFIGLAEQEYAPQIKFASTVELGMCVNKPTFSMDRVQLVGSDATHAITLLKLDADNTASDGNVDSYITNCAFVYGETGIMILGRNVKIHHNIFSTIGIGNGGAFTGKGIVLAQTQNITTEQRGVIVTDNRFHGVSICFLNNVTSYSGEGCSTVVDNNYFDNGLVFYQGTSDNVAIRNNYISGIRVGSTVVIVFSRTISAASTTVVENNFCNATQTYVPGNYPRCFLSLDGGCNGTFQITGNVFNTLYSGATDYVMAFPTDAGVKRIIIICNNTMVNRAQASNIWFGNPDNNYGVVANNIVNGAITNGANMHQNNNASIAGALS